MKSYLTIINTHIASQKAMFMLNEQTLASCLKTAFYHAKTEDSVLIVHQKDAKHYITLHTGSNAGKQTLLSRFFKDTNAEDLRLHFHNPACLPWRPSETMTHPCFIGPAVNSPSFQFYLEHKFRHETTQVVYGRELQDFVVPSEVLARRDALKNAGIAFTYYDPTRHSGLKPFAENLNTPAFYDALHPYMQASPHAPLLIAVYKGRVIAFAGPLKKETTGRGFFSGIAVSAMYQGKSIGKVLFFELCARLKAMDADYMTLFTGINNPARKIYEAAGFKALSFHATMCFLSHGEG